MRAPLVRAVLALTLVTSLSATSYGAVKIVANFIDGATTPEQWNATQKATFNAAMGYLGSQFNPTYTGQEWQFDVKLTLQNEGALAEAGPEVWGQLTQGSVTLEYAGALYNTVVGSAHFSGALATIDFNYNVDWNYSTTPGGVMPGDKSFFTTAVHEATHGLGFTSLLKEDGSWVDGDPPGVYDSFLGYTQGMTTTSLLDLTQSERATAYTSNSLFWTGENGNEANPAEVPIQIYAPNPAESGSSISHIDPDVSPDSLLLYPFQLSGQIESFTFSEMELGMLRDMGYSVVPEPGIGILLLLGGLAALAMRRRPL